MIGTKLSGPLFPLWCEALLTLAAQRTSRNAHLAMVQHRQRHLGRAYTQLRRVGAPLALRRALRRQLNQAERQHAEAREVAG